MAGKKGMRWGKKLAQESREELSVRQYAIAVKDKARELVPDDCPEAPERGKPGKPSRYCKVIVELILLHVIRALPLETACRLANVEPPVFLDWCKAHPELIRAVETARAASQDILLNKVEDGTAKNPRLALDILERRYPKYFAQAKNVNHTGTIGHNHSNWGVLHDGIDVQSDVQDAQVVDAATPALTDASQMLTELCPENDGQPGGAEGAGSPHPSPKNV